MTQSTHFHQNLAINTDQKFRAEDEGIVEQEKQHFQSSETEKRDEPPEEGLSSTAPEEIANRQNPK